MESAIFRRSGVRFERAGAGLDALDMMSVGGREEEEEEEEEEKEEEEEEEPPKRRGEGGRVLLERDQRWVGPGWGVRGPSFTKHNCRPVITAQ
jgi:hypothetical protein